MTTLRERLADSAGRVELDEYASRLSRFLADDAKPIDGVLWATGVNCRYLANGAALLEVESAINSGVLGTDRIRFGLRAMLIAEAAWRARVERDTQWTTVNPSTCASFSDIAKIGEDCSSVAAAYLLSVPTLALWFFVSVVAGDRACQSEYQSRMAFLSELGATYPVHADFLAFACLLAEARELGQFPILHSARRDALGSYCALVEGTVGDAEIAKVASKIADLRVQDCLSSQVSPDTDYGDAYYQEFFGVWPVELLAYFATRREFGLSAPVPDHPIFAVVPGKLDSAPRETIRESGVLDAAVQRLRDAGIQTNA